jgi:hypothetical protein
MKTKEVTCTFEYTTPEDLQQVLNRVYKEVTKGKEYFEKVCKTEKGMRLIQFKQEYRKLRSFKIVNTDSVIVKANI